MDQIHKGQFDQIKELDEEQFLLSELPSRKSFEYQKNQKIEEDYELSAENQDESFNNEPHEISYRELTRFKTDVPDCERIDLESTKSIKFSRRNISKEKDSKSRKKSEKSISRIEENSLHKLPSRVVNDDFVSVVGIRPENVEEMILLSNDQNEDQNSGFDNSFWIEKDQIQSSTLIPNSFEKRREKCRSKSENIRKENSQTLDIRIKECDFGGHSHKLDSTKERKKLGKIESLGKKVCQKENFQNNGSYQVEKNEQSKFEKSNHYETHNQNLQSKIHFALKTEAKQSQSRSRSRSRSRSPSPKQKMKTPKKLLRRHKKCFSLFSTVSPFKKTQTLQSSNRLSYKHGKHNQQFSLTQSNFFSQKEHRQKKDTFAKKTASSISELRKHRDWSPTSQKLLKIRKKIRSKRYINR